jgi:hypothetical protein
LAGMHEVHRWPISQRDIWHLQTISSETPLIDTFTARQIPGRTLKCADRPPEGDQTNGTLKYTAKIHNAMVWVRAVRLLCDFLEMGDTEVERVAPWYLLVEMMRYERQLRRLIV